jgi:Ca2+-binding EF-hand superfamily protein
MQKFSFGLVVSAAVVLVCVTQWLTPDETVVKASVEPHAIIQEKAQHRDRLRGISVPTAELVVPEAAMPPALNSPELVAATTEKDDLRPEPPLKTLAKVEGEESGKNQGGEGEASEKAGGEEEALTKAEKQAHHDEVATAFFCCLVALIMGTIFFEAVKDMILESVEDSSLAPVVDAMFAELTVLGFIGLISFVLVKLNVLAEISEAVFRVGKRASEKEIEESRERVPEMFETLHMMLFLVMIIFIIEVMILLYFGRRIQASWATIENISHEPEKLQEVLEVWDTSGEGCCSANSLPSCEAEDPWDGSKLEFTLDYLSLRAEFVDAREGYALGNDYDFADYLAHVMGKTLSTIVTVTVTEWLLLLLIMAGFYALSVTVEMSAKDISIGFSMLMYVLAFCLLALKTKLEWIVKQLVSRNKGRAYAQQLVDNWKAEQAKAAELREVARSAKSTPRTPECSKDIPESDQESRQKDELQEPDPEHPKLDETLKEDESESTPLVGAEHTIDMEQTTSKKKKGEIDPAMLPPFKLLEQSTERSCWVQLFLGNTLPNQHQQLFWFQNKGPSWNRTFLQLLLVCNAIFVPNIILTLHYFTEDLESGKLALWEYIGFLVFISLPIMLIFCNIGKALQFQLIAANTEQQPGGNAFMVQKCKLSQQAAKVMYVLQIINRLRKKADIIATTTTSKKEPTTTTPRPEIDPKRLKEIEDIFDYFDADHSGALDVEEIEQFLVSLGHTGDTATTAKMVVEELDQPDGDEAPNGEVDKEEFVNWMVASEASQNYDESNTEIASKMFKMFNDDGDDYVTPEEFNSKLQMFGIKLSQDELHLLVRELDSDGSGRIDEDDFEAMLERHDFS